MMNVDKDSMDAQARTRTGNDAEAPSQQHGDGDPAAGVAIPSGSGLPQLAAGSSLDGPRYMRP